MSEPNAEGQRKIRKDDSPLKFEKRRKDKKSKEEKIRLMKFPCVAKVQLLILIKDGPNLTN